MIAPTAKIHAMACVDGVGGIGARSAVWQFASVIRGAILGDDCNVASGATIDGSRFGDRCRIGHGVAMGPGFHIADDVFVGPNVTFCNDAWPRASKTGFDVSRFDGSRWAVTVDNGASIGANAVIMAGVSIGANAMIAAGEVVRADVVANTLLIGGVARYYETPLDKRERMRFAQC